ncbi:unnamed protein product [Rotaria socialis]|uniref:F-box domain-containing protein n=1 Tax=Rotaria socialis TaxID=392032 RepID=A0A821FSM5_9BILA|nr:unnamed protein product [Rotaria socialis]CAF3672722.1 unnamed protein product [Rotaria socialis]CAF4245774.1 unnamed protein product [Rotaria socialis]CAF4657250.1 unnamed protein product [Rotaria socialis]
MNHSTVNILALCDEMVLAILNKLNNMDVLYSLIGVNKKLDSLVRDITFTQSIDLVTISSNEHNDSRNKSILDRFCFDIIPRIQHNIESLTLDPLSIDRVLCIGNYSKLHKVALVNVQFEIASRIFNNESSFVRNFKHQIFDLTVTINADRTGEHICKLFTNVFTIIFIMFTNLIYLDFRSINDCLSSPRSLNKFLSPTIYSSNIVHLNVRVYNFNDCLCLLDGDLSQLHTFIVQVDTIYNTSMIINIMKTVSTLKHFSLTSYRRTREYDNKILPLLRQMLQLEKLTLSLRVCSRTSLIDGTHLLNDILSEMSHLHTFIFNIITQSTMMNKELLPTPDDVSRPLIQRGYNVGCYTDFCQMEMCQCHIYSLPFTMERMDTLSNKFPGGLFMTVRHLVTQHLFRPFEHDFFVRISHAFPLLNKLILMNKNEQEEKLTYQKNEHEQTSSIIEFSHLMILNFTISALDYAEQFLSDVIARLPCLNTLCIKYIDLVCVTQNFRNNAARANCSKLQHTIFDSPPTTYPENFYHYFPLLCSK